MPYRDEPVDQRVVELRALIASEPELRADAARLRRESDEVAGDGDRVGVALSEAERDLEKRREGGVIATVSGWFGRSLEEHEAEVSRLRTEHAALTTRIAALAAAELDVRDRLTALTSARAELVDREAAAIESLRAAEGPNADELRAIDRDDARDHEIRKAVLRVIDLCDIARVAVWSVDAILTDLRKITTTASTVLAVIERFDSPLNTPAVVADRKRCRIRLGEAVEYAAGRIENFIRGFDQLAFPWFATMPRQRLLQLASSPLADPSEDTASVQEAEAMADCLSEITAKLAAERDRLDGGHVERAARRRELVGF